MWPFLDPLQPGRFASPSQSTYSRRVNLKSNSLLFWTFWHYDALIKASHLPPQRFYSPWIIVLIQQYLFSLQKVSFACYACLCTFSLFFLLGFVPMKGDWVQAKYTSTSTAWGIRAYSVAPLRYCRRDRVIASLKVFLFWGGVGFNVVLFSCATIRYINNLQNATLVFKNQFMSVSVTATLSVLKLSDYNLSSGAHHQRHECWWSGRGWYLFQPPLRDDAGELQAIARASGKCGNPGKQPVSLPLEGPVSCAMFSEVWITVFVAV